MNEPLFKNSFVRDEKTIKEFYKHNYLTATRFKIIYIGYAVLILLSLLTYDISLFAFYLVLGIVMALVILFSYWQNVKILIARDKETSNGKDLIVEILVFDDRIEHAILETKNTLHFDNIRSVEQTKNYICVMTNAKLAYIFKKDSFTLGNAEDFIEFLKSKGIKVQK